MILFLSTPWTHSWFEASYLPYQIMWFFFILRVSEGVWVVSVFSCSLRLLLHSEETASKGSFRSSNSTVCQSSLPRQPSGPRQYALASLASNKQSWRREHLELIWIFSKRLHRARRGPCPLRVSLILFGKCYLQCWGQPVSTKSMAWIAVILTFSFL